MCVRGCSPSVPKDANKDGRHEWQTTPLAPHLLNISTEGLMQQVHGRIIVNFSEEELKGQRGKVKKQPCQAEDEQDRVIYSFKKQKSSGTL